jgi:hypothetical protein
MNRTSFYGDFTKKPGVKSGAREGQAVPASDMTLTVLRVTHIYKTNT